MLYIAREGDDVYYALTDDFLNNNQRGFKNIGHSPTSVECIAILKNGAGTLEDRGG
jgi:hypothetical protein